MSKTDLNTLIAIRDKDQLTYTKQDMSYAAYGKPFNQNSDQSILDDVSTIEKIMKRYDASFVEFKSFTEDNRIRYDYQWDASFIGVGYTHLDILKVGFPLGNFSKECIDKTLRARSWKTKYTKTSLMA